MTTIQSHSEEETIALATEHAKSLKKGDVLCLYGDLGAGKSVFSRALIRACVGLNIDVPSPTFTLVQTYDATIAPLWHFDLYRLEDAEDVYELGWEEAISEGIILLEWPERIAAHLPQNRYDIHIKILDQTTREISISTPQ